MKSSFLILIFYLLGCADNRKNEAMEKHEFGQQTFYEDIDFVNMKGLRPIDSPESLKTYFRIVNENNKVKIISYMKPRSLNMELVSDSIVQDSEVFINKNGGYYLKEEEIDNDSPNRRMVKEVFIIDKLIFVSTNIYDRYSNKPISSKAEKIDVVNYTVERLKFYKKSIVLTGNIDFMKLSKSKDIFNHILFKIHNKTFGLDINIEEKDSVNEIIEARNEKYYGYPETGELNNYWNLYRGFFGKELN